MEELKVLGQKAEQIQSRAAASGKMAGGEGVLKEEEMESESLEMSILDKFEGGDGRGTEFGSLKQRAVAKNEQRFIVDRDISDTSIEGVFVTIQ